MYDVELTAQARHLHQAVDSSFAVGALDVRYRLHVLQGDARPVERSHPCVGFVAFGWFGDLVLVFGGSGHPRAMKPRIRVGVVVAVMVEEEE
jgi:hypothetical protein